MVMSAKCLKWFPGSITDDEVEGQFGGEERPFTAQDKLSVVLLARTKVKDLVKSLIVKAKVVVAATFKMTNSVTRLGDLLDFV